MWSLDGEDWLGLLGLWYGWAAVEAAVDTILMHKSHRSTIELLGNGAKAPRRFSSLPELGTISLVTARVRYMEAELAHAVDKNAFVANAAWQLAK